MRERKRVPKIKEKLPTLVKLGATPEWFAITALISNRSFFFSPKHSYHFHYVLFFRLLPYFFKFYYLFNFLLPTRHNARRYDANIFCLQQTLKRILRESQVEFFETMILYFCFSSWIYVADGWSQLSILYTIISYVVVKLLRVCVQLLFLALCFGGPFW